MVLDVAPRLRPIHGAPSQVLVPLASKIPAETEISGFAVEQELDPFLSHATSRYVLVREQSKSMKEACSIQLSPNSRLLRQVLEGRQHQQVDGQHPRVLGELLWGEVQHRLGGSDLRLRSEARPQPTSKPQKLI